MLAVAKYLIFRHAANAFDVSLLSLSACVKALEQGLDILLFERHVRGERLTESRQIVRRARSNER